MFRRPTRTFISALLLASCNSDPGDPEPDAVLLLSTPAHDFGVVTVGAESSTLSLSITNTGSASTGVLSVVLEGPAAAEFAIFDDECTGVALAPDEQCELRVWLRPTSSGSKEASLAVAAGAGGRAVASFRGTAASVALSTSVSSLAFGEVGLGGQSPVSGILVRNFSLRPSGPLAVQVVGGHAPDFEITRDTCVGQSLIPGGSCVIDLRFRPNVAGPRSATLRISGDPGGVAVAALAGASGASTTLTATPAARDFGMRTVGGTTTPSVFTISNTGSAPTGTLLVNLTGAHPADFRFDGNACSGMVLAAGASCEVGVRFQPGTNGSRTAALEVLNPYGDDAMATLTGTGVSASLSVTPAALNFSSVLIGTTSSSRFTVTNTGNAASGVLRTSFSDNSSYYGPGPQQFEMPTDECDFTELTPGASCAITVTFVPTAHGYHDASVYLFYAADFRFIASGYASGTGAGVQLGAASLDFAATAVGGVSAAQVLRVSNTAGSATGALTTSVVGTSFSIESDGCAGAPLPPAGTCLISVRFGPGAAGIHSGSISVSASPGGAESAALRGQGF